MIFDKLADAITGHAKLIVAIWAVILIVAAPLALKAGDVMLYDTNEMAGSDSESVKGLEVIDEYFSSSGVDVSSLPIVVLKFDNVDEMREAESLFSKLNDPDALINSGRWTSERKNPNPSGKISNTPPPHGQQYEEEEAKQEEHQHADAFTDH